MGLCFLCIADKEMGRRIPFAFLEEAVSTFQRKHEASRLKDATDERLCSDYQAFKDDMCSIMQRCNSPDADRILAMQHKVKDINDKVMSALEELLNRGEKIEDLVKRTESLAIEAVSFRRSASSLEREM